MIRNFETVKLLIPSPNLTNTALLLLLCLASLVSIKKAPAGSHQFFSPLQTRQMRGAAILLVLLGHVWVHVAEHAASIILSGYAVALFFFLSGFGLTVTAEKKQPISFSTFFMHRIRRVMMPYWCVTVILITLDTLLLEKAYSLSNIILTFMGINITKATTHIDYVRWYITLQLLWYGIFYFTVMRLPAQRALMLVGACAVVIFFFDYYITRQGWAHLFAFPLGCVFGFHRKCFHTAFEKYHLLCMGGAGAAVIWTIFYKGALDPYASTHLPQIICKLINEANGVLCALGICFLIAGLGRYGLMSRFLLVCGSLSYELFLLHGPVLIKYNPVFSTSGTVLFIGQYLLLLVLIICLAWIFQQLVLLMPFARTADTYIR